MRSRGELALLPPGAPPCPFLRLPLQEALTARCHYVGDFVDTTRRSPRMAVDTKAPGQAPPDLPSLLLDGRICYIGMPVRARVGWGWEGSEGSRSAGQLLPRAPHGVATCQL